jgi:PAS domain S-box-containing protein
MLLHTRRRRVVLGELAAARESFEKLFEANPLPVIAYDRRSGIILETNAAAVDLYGYSREEFRSLRMDALYSQRQPAKAEPAIERHDGDIPVVWQRRKNGPEFPARLMEDDLSFRGQPSRIAAVVDLTEVFEAERQRERAVEARLLAEQAKTNFLSTISHELRTPLNAISGFTTLLRDEGDPRLRAEFVQIVEDKSAEMLQLVDLLLAAASAHSTGIRLRPARFSVAIMLDALREHYAPACEAKGMSFAVVAGPSVPDMLHLDELRLRQILQNLLSNAVKFSSSGTITLSVTASGRGADARICFGVADEGGGIPAEHLNQIFQPFAQLDAGTTRRFAGPGVGLFICKQLVELMGGTIQIESAKRRGTTFTVDLPLHQPGVAEEPEPEPSRLTF